MPERISRSVNNDLGKGDSLDASFEDYRISLFIVSPASPHRRPSGELTCFLVNSTALSITNVTGFRWSHLLTDDERFKRSEYRRPIGAFDCVLFHFYAVVCPVV